MNLPIICAADLMEGKCCLIYCILRIGKFSYIWAGPSQYHLCNVIKAKVHFPVVVDEGCWTLHKGVHRMMKSSRKLFAAAAEGTPVQHGWRKFLHLPSLKTVLADRTSAVVHVWLDIDQKCTFTAHPDNIEAFARQVVTRDKWGFLTFYFRACMASWTCVPVCQDQRNAEKALENTVNCLHDDDYREIQRVHM